MNALRFILVLIVAAGILLCPYRCMAGGCGKSASGVQNSGGCHCKNCQREKAAVPKLPEDGERSPGDGHDCVCVCDGAIITTANDDCILPAPELAFEFAIVDECESTLVACYGGWAADDPGQCYLKDGRAMRILFQSFLI